MLPYEFRKLQEQPHPLLRHEETTATDDSLKSLHVWTEQGFGDSLQYLRWLIPLSQNPNAITLEVEHQLVELVQQGLSWLPHPPAVVAKPKDGSAAPAIEGDHCSLLSLPHHLGGAPLTHTVPYLRSDGWPLASAARSTPHRPALGRRPQADDPFTAREYRKRSLSPEARAVGGGLHQSGAQLRICRWVPTERWRPRWPSLRRCSARKCRLRRHRRRVRQLDLVICGHRYGPPCRCLGPSRLDPATHAADPRWLRDRSDSPWYPSLRLFRQPQPGTGAHQLTDPATTRHLWARVLPQPTNLRLPARCS